MRCFPSGDLSPMEPQQRNQAQMSNKTKTPAPAAKAPVATVEAAPAPVAASAAPSLAEAIAAAKAARQAAKAARDQMADLRAQAKAARETAKAAAKAAQEAIERDRLANAPTLAISDDGTVTLDMREGGIFHLTEAGYHATGMTPAIYDGLIETIRSVLDRARVTYDGNHPALARRTPIETPADDSAPAPTVNVATVLTGGA